MVFAPHALLPLLSTSTLSKSRASSAQQRHYRPATLRSARRGTACKTKASAADDEPDFIERIFGRLFGNKALEERAPGGMKRMSDEALLEQYPATLTEFAEPVDSDDNTVAKFRPLLAQTRLQRLPLRYAAQF